MKRLRQLCQLFFLLSIGFVHAQDPWKLTVPSVSPSNYYGVTVANGMIGIVSSPEPFKVKEVVLAGAYDQYGRGRVSNFLRSFNLLNMQLGIDGRNISGADVKNMKQDLDMKKASLPALSITVIKLP